MATTRHVSSFEALPPEIFNHVLEYLFDPNECQTEESPNAFRSYRFDTTLLRVSKSVHALAKSHLHHSLSWIRLEINWDAFLIDPRSRDVPFINIHRADTPKSVPLPYSGDMKRRSPNQQAPPGRLVVRVKFPAPKSPVQRAIRLSCFSSPFGASMSILVLEQDFVPFVEVLCMNDAAYCYRMLPTPQTPTKVLTTRSNEGLSIDAEVQSGFAVKRYKHLLESFRYIHGPFHKLTIIGHEESPRASTIANIVELRLPNTDRREAMMKAKVDLCVDTIKDIMELKLRGDESLRHGDYAGAFLRYKSASALEDSWTKSDPQPSTQIFWKEPSNVHRAFGTALACNIAISHMAGGFDAPFQQLRGLDMMAHVLELGTLSRNGTTLPKPRFIELLFPMLVYHFSDTCTSATVKYPWVLDRMKHALVVMNSSFLHDYDTESPHEDTKWLQTIYEYVDRMLALLQVGESPTIAPQEKEPVERLILRNIKDMQQALVGVKIAPLSWAIHEDQFPDQFCERADNLPAIWIDPGRISGTHHHITIAYPSFSEPDPGTFETGEEGERRAI